MGSRYVMWEGGRGLIQQAVLYIHKQTQNTVKSIRIAESVAKRENDRLMGKKGGCQTITPRIS